MSDMTTITAEERARLRSVLSEHGTPQVEDRIILRLLNTAEQAEGRAEKAEVENARLQQRVNELISEELTDGAVRERIQLRFNMHEVLQQNERLTKMADWLAELVFDRPCAYACCPFDKHRPTGPDDDDCDKTHIQCWAEAARRAVAAVEETCQK